ncbi:MAG: hypothetical protein P1V20_16715 [Verrucomicrobiales bacterium]|nr:hypothetical protein [Verrucomicrobiales bacterium]
MKEWIDIAKTFLADYWLAILIVMVVLYYLYNYIMLLVAIVIFPITVVGAAIWDLQKNVHWPQDEDNRLTPRNFFFFLAGSLAFFIEIWLFSLFLEYYLLGESVMPLFGNVGVRMSVVSGIGFGMLTLIFGHLAHHLLARPKDQDGETTEAQAKGISSERVVGWAAGIFFLIATIVLGYSGGLRAYTLATAAEASLAVVFFSISIGAIFGFMMPFGAVVGMSRGGFLWHFFRNILLGIPLMLGMLLLIVAAFIFFLVEIILTVATLLIRQVFTIIAGLAGIRLSDKESHQQLSGWRIGLLHLTESAAPPERLGRFLDIIRQRINFWDVDESPKQIPRAESGT